jgi:hypothetical protein
MNEQEMHSTLARLHIMPQTVPVMTRAGLVWRERIGDEGWKKYRADHSNLYGKVHERDVLDALMAEGFATLKTGLITVDEAVTIINDYIHTHYPDLDVTYTRNVLNVQAYHQVLPVYKRPRMITGRPSKRSAFYDWRDVFTLAEQHINPRVSLARRRHGRREPPEAHDDPLVALVS